MNTTERLDTVNTHLSRDMNGAADFSSQWLGSETSSSKNPFAPEKHPIEDAMDHFEADCLVQTIFLHILISVSRYSRQYNSGQNYYLHQPELEKSSF